MLGSPSTDDRQLIQDYLRGDRAALQTLDGWIEVVLHEHFRSLEQDWDDLRQEVRIRVLRNLCRGSFSGRSSLRTYVHRIAKNVCIDFSRRAYRHREGTPVLEEIPVDAVGPKGVFSGWIARDLLDKILKDLTEEDRVLIRMVFSDHYSYREVARELGIPEGTVKSRMSRCKDRILKRRRDLSGR